MPEELQAVLVRPYLSERAKILMSKCDPAHTATYQAIKKFLLQELHLSSSVYLNKFNSLARDKDKTFGQFSTRLVSLFEYHMESRNIDHSYERLVDLVVYGRIKSQLTPFLARHVLALEAAHNDGWLGRLGLVEAVDAYVANTQNDGKPKMPIPLAQFRSSVNYTNGKRVPDVPKPPTGKVEPVTLQKPVLVSRTGIVKRCFICSSPHHLF